MSMDFKETQLKNIRGIRITRQGERVFHCVLSLDTHVGSREHKTEAIGLVYVKALLSGCQGYSREAFLDAIHTLGASLTVGIDHGIVTIALTSIDKHMHKLLKLLEAMLLAPTFAQTEITRIIGLLQNELHEEQEDAKTQSLYLLIDSLYQRKDRRYVSPTNEVIKTIKTVNKKDLQAFHTLATQSKWVYTIICDETEAIKTATKLEKMRTSFKDFSEANSQHYPKEDQKSTVELLSIPSKQNIEINIGGLLPLHINDKEYYAFVFGLNVLGKWGGFAGRLMSTVREKEGLTYGIYARTETTARTEYGFWRIMTFFAPDKVQQGITSTLREIDSIRTKGITQSEYIRFKTIIKTGEALLRDSIIKTAATMQAAQIKGLSYDEIGEHQQNMLLVSRSEVNAALKKYLDPHKLVIAAAGPVSNKTKELKTLAHLAKSKK